MAGLGQPITRANEGEEGRRHLSCSGSGHGRGWNVIMFRFSRMMDLACCLASFHRGDRGETKCRALGEGKKSDERSTDDALRITPGGPPPQYRGGPISVRVICSLRGGIHGVMPTSERQLVKPQHSIRPMILALLLPRWDRAVTFSFGRLGRNVSTWGRCLPYLPSPYLTLQPAAG